MKRLLIAAFLLAGCATSGAGLVSPAPVIAAERAFAADAAVRGWTAAFRTYAAPDALMLSPDPVNAQAQLAEIEGDGTTALDWRPAYAGIARSGDLGFTTGPFQFRGREGIVGHYFTVWQRQTDGSWKWIFDAGTGVRDPGPAVAGDADIPTLQVSGGRSRSSDAAVAEVAALENEGAPGTHLAAEVRVNRAGEPAGIGAAAGAALFAADGPVTYTTLRHEASAGGDMVFSLGEVHDQHEGAERLRYYARIWQRQALGWRIVFDEIVPRRGG